jgi:hypothetical protein
MLICLAAIAVLAVPIPFVISGWIFYENGTDCDDPAVNITNTDTGMSWQDDKTTGSNYYQIIYTNGTGVGPIKGAGVNITASADVTGALNDTNRTSWIHISNSRWAYKRMRMKGRFFILS